MSLEYKDIKIDGRVRISPSSIYQLYDNPSKWWTKNVLGIKEPMNNNLLIGTLIHNRIYRFFQKLEVDYDEEVAYLQQFSNNPEINDWEVFDVVEETWKYLLEEHIPTMIKPTDMEVYVEYIPKTNDTIFVGGSYDYRYKNDNRVILGDFKTANTVSKSIKTHHRLQLLIYAWLLKMQGISINTIEITYIQKYDKGEISEKTGKQIKQKKPEVSVVQEDITDDDLSFIQDELVKIGKRIKVCKLDESMVELVFPTNYLSHF